MAQQPAIPDWMHDLEAEASAIKAAKAIAAPKQGGDQKSRPVSKTESALRGAEQGATMGFADEFRGAAQAAGRKLGDAVFGTPGQAGYWDRYREVRDENRAANEAAHEANQKTYTGSNIAAGVAAGLLAPAGTGAVTIGKTIAAGTAMGGAAGLGMSDADVTKGDVSGAITDTAVGAGIGAGAGLVGYGAAKGAGGIYRKLTGKPASTGGAAAKLASEVAGNSDDVASVGHAASGRSFYQRSLELQDDIIAKTGDDFRFSPAEATADPAAALAESKAAQFPRTMRDAQAGRAARLKTTAKYLDSLTDHIAADPAKLGKTDVAAGLSDAVEKHMGDLLDARSAEAAPLYKAAAEAGTTVPVDDIVGAIKSQIDENKFNPSSMTSQMKALLAKVQDASISADGLPIADVQNLRSLLSKASTGKASIIDNMPVANQARIAGEILTAIDSTLDDVAESTGGAGAEYLKRANAVWRKHSEAIKSLPLDALNKVMKVGSGETSDTLLSKILTMSDEQLSGVARVVNKSDPAAMQQLRAGVLDTLFNQAGKPQRGAPIAAEIGAATLNPGKALDLLVKYEPKIQALYAGDNKALLALRQSMQTLQRLSGGPGLRGAQTAPLLAQAADEAAATLGAAGGPHGLAIIKAIKSFFGSEKALAKAVSSPAGIDAFNDAMRIQTGIIKGTKIPAKTAAAFLATVTKLGLVSRSEDEEPRVVITPGNLQASRIEQ